MKRPTIWPVCLIALAIAAFTTNWLTAQTSHTLHVPGSEMYGSTVVPQDRYELVLSTMTTEPILRLDKFTGQTKQMSEVGGIIRYVPVRWPTETLNETLKPKVPNFQIFVPALPGKGTYLMNIHSGRTWHLVSERGRDGFAWEPVNR